MTGRPTMTAAIEREAALEFAERLLEIIPDPSREGETREALLERIVESLAYHRGHIRQGSAYVGQLLGEQIGFKSNELVQELAEYLPTMESNALAKHVRHWVQAQQVKPPFEKACHARLNASGIRRQNLKGEIVGVAIRRPDLDRSAYARFVTDADREEYVASRGLRGHRLVLWEDLIDIRPLADPVSFAVADASRRRDLDVSARNAPAASRTGTAFGANRILTATPDARAKTVLELVEEAREALTGQDEDQARQAIRTLQEGLGALQAIERSEGPTRLTPELTPALGA